MVRARNEISLISEERVMAIPDSVLSYLARENAEYEVTHHPRSATGLQTAIAAHVDPGHLAKAVLLRDEEGYFLAVLPASRDLDMHALERQFGRRPNMAEEKELTRKFPDCALGAVPALGSAYRIDTVVDDTLRGLPEVWFEAGDHEEVIRLDGETFERLLADAWFGAISRPPAA
jgi:Ala-tRNA(Pro) deacylase